MPDPSSGALTVGAEQPSRDALVLEAGGELLRPLVGLMLAHGVKYGPLTELLKHLMVDVARENVPGASQARAVSRISVATGIHRKEVKRLLEAPAGEGRLAKRSLSAEVFTRWLTDPRYSDPAGRPRELPRQATLEDLPSFEALAREISRDVHPRTVLEELLRLGIVEMHGERVRVVAQAFVPAAEDRDMLRFLADNAGDHLRAAIANIERRDDRFLEQAVAADELSEVSVQAIETLARERWADVLRELVPRIRALSDADHAQGRAPVQRVRVGMFSYAAPMSGVTAVPDATAPSATALGRATRRAGSATPGSEPGAGPARRPAAVARRTASLEAARRRRAPAKPDSEPI